MMDYELFLKAVATLEANNVPPDKNGNYIRILSPAEVRQYDRWRRERCRVWRHYRWKRPK